MFGDNELRKFDYRRYQYIKKEHSNYFKKEEIEELEEVSL